MKTIKIRKKQSGFALIEVMLAALVMTVGGVAYMRLQQLGLQYNYNNYARTQGIAIAQGFAEQLRSNVGYLRTQNTVISDSVKTNQAAPTSVVNCQSDSSSTSAKKACGLAAFNWAKYVTAQQMAAVSGTAVLCYQERAAGTGNMRMTYLWRDNSAEGKTASLDCPAAFDSALTAGTTNNTHANSVTVYVQL